MRARPLPCPAARRKASQRSGGTETEQAPPPTAGPSLVEIVAFSRRGTEKKLKAPLGRTAPQPRSSERPARLCRASTGRRTRFEAHPARTIAPTVSAIESRRRDPAADRMPRIRRERQPRDQATTPVPAMPVRQRRVSRGRRASCRAASPQATAMSVKIKTRKPRTPGSSGASPGEIPQDEQALG